MANLPENPVWEIGIRQLELTDPVQGGPDGVDNMAPKQLANRTAYLKQEVELRAPIASPAFTGHPTAPTQAPGNNSTRLANTAFVQAALAALVDSSPAALDTLNELAAALGDDPDFATTVMNALALKAPLESPALTGSPTAGTPSPSSNSSRIATTAFVRSFAVPAGFLGYWSGDTPPPGWLKRNGALISRAAYPDLWAHAQASGMIVSDAAWVGGKHGMFSTGDGATTFRIPDGRAEFDRGWDDGRGIDAGRVLGSWQEDEFEEHTHQWEGSNLSTGSGYPTITGNNDQNRSYSTDRASTPPGGSETRPRNIAYLPIIKF